MSIVIEKTWVDLTIFCPHCGVRLAKNRRIRPCKWRGIKDGKKWEVLMREYVCDTCNKPFAWVKADALI